MTDFLIVGGGIIGLLLARELAQSQAQVVVVDQGACGREASWAGGGIISPLYPWRYAAAITALASWAQDFYPDLVQELVAETGIDTELRRCGLLMLAAEEEAKALAWAQAHGRRMQDLAVDDIYRREPALAPGYLSGLWMPDVCNIRNPRLIKALLASLANKPNVQVRAHTRVINLERADGIIHGAIIDTGIETMRLQAKSVIVCAGAWSGELMQRVGLTLPVEPVKGQMLLYKFPRMPIHSILLTAGRYLIPRVDGHLLVGSTLEYRGFDKSPSSEARNLLQQSAYSLLPELRELQPLAHWAGLRPAAPEGIPFIGKMPEFDNLYVNAGQFRNGLVLAPASARLLADGLLGRTPILDPAPYDPVLRSKRQPA